MTNEHITRQTETIASLSERIGQADRSGLSPITSARLTIGLEEVRSQLARILDSIPSVDSRAESGGPLFG